jgi:glyoxylase-like metal-dependent hydrolase (beta-lactamase superfamily II)
VAVRQWDDGKVVVEQLLTGMVTPTEEGNLVLASVVSIRSPHGHVLVDTGGPNQRLALQARLNSLPEVSAVVLTHFHWDHCANLALFPGQPIYAKVEPKWFDRATLNDVQCIPTIVNVHEGDQIDSWVRILEVPGHTANHIAVEVETRHGVIAITGDAIATAHDAVRGGPELVFFSEDAARIQAARLLKRARWIIPGHDVAFEVGHS